MTFYYFIIIIEAVRFHKKEPYFIETFPFTMQPGLFYRRPVMPALLFIMKSKLNYWQGSSRCCKVLPFLPGINYSSISRGEYLSQTRPV